MQSNSHPSYALPSIGTLITEEKRKLLLQPLLKPCALVLVTMLIMVLLALSLGIWWDALWSAG